jgi:hypothetical protein
MLGNGVNENLWVLGLRNEAIRSTLSRQIMQITLWQ